MAALSPESDGRRWAVLALLGVAQLTAVLVVTSTTVQTRVLYRTGAKPLAPSEWRSG
jgi:hypothetical protein